MRLGGPAIPAALAAAAAAVLAGCGGQDQPAHHGDRPAQAAATPSGGAVVHPVPAADRDSEGDQAFALPAGAEPDTKRAKAPSAVAVHRTAKATPDDSVSPGAPSDDEVRKELQQLEGIQAAQHHADHAAAEVGQGLTRRGNARIPSGLPDAVARVLAGGNAIARYPYVYGGGHRSFVDDAYDCSGSVSYALAAGGFLGHPLTSGQLAHSGAPGPGRYITIYANGGHTFMYVDGLRFDTSGRGGPRGSRWQTAPRSVAGFHVRHPPGY